MWVTGVGIGFIDCEPEVTEAFNRWYDLDYLPENVALPEVVGARRYVATADCKAARGPGQLQALADGRGTFCTTYLFGHQDFSAIQASMRALARRLAKAGRMFHRAKTALYEPHRLVRTYVGRDLAVAPEAVPFIGHTGIYLSMGEAASPEHRERVDAWYDQVHIPDVLEVPGFLACLRLIPVQPEHTGRFLHLFFLDEDPVQALGRLRAMVPKWRQRGRLPSVAGMQRPLFRAPYRLIRPLHYEF